MGDGVDPKTVADELVGTLGASTGNKDVLEFAGKELAAQRGFFAKMADMLKGASAVVPPVEGGEDEGSSGRGAGYMLKGWACKGAEGGDPCGYRMPMKKGHSNFGKKRQLADEMAKGKSCPRGGGDVSPLMDKGEDELPYGEADMDKGTDTVLEDPRLDIFMEDLMSSMEQRVEDSARLVELSEMLKGVEDRMSVLEDVPSFMEATVAEATSLREGVELQQDMMKGLIGTTLGSGDRQLSVFDQAAAGKRRAVEEDAGSTDMAKGSEGTGGASDDGLTEAELDKGVKLGKIKSFDKVRYRAGGNMTGFGRSVETFRKAIE